MGLVSGDTLFVWDLDRAFRSTEDALFHEKDLRKRGIKFHAMNFEIDTVTADGKYSYTITAAAAERERKKISERTIEGLIEAVKRGVRLGPPLKLSDSQARVAMRKIEAKDASIAEMAARYGVHSSTIIRSIRRLEAKSSEWATSILLRFITNNIYILPKFICGKHNNTLFCIVIICYNL